MLGIIPYISEVSKLVNITIKNLTFSYNSHKILDDLNVVIENSEILSLVGPNGSGKTTLIKCIDRILKPRGRWTGTGENEPPGGGQTDWLCASVQLHSPGNYGF
jgi:energy-coupling factor transporter ATP-binding protein EcfA2